MISMRKERATIDTNVLLDYPNVIEDFETVILPSAILEELDKLKKDRERGFRARMASRKVASASNITFIVKDNYDMPLDWDKAKMDNKIVMCAKENGCIMVTNDLTVRAKANAIGIPYEGYEKEGYSGVFVVEGDTETVNAYFGAREYENLLENQYLIVRQTDVTPIKETEMVFRNGTLNPLRLPAQQVISGMNAHQRCALDLLMNDDIPVKVIAGEAGSGKTKLSVEIGYHLTIEEKKYDRMVLVRNPIGSGEEIGFMPGGFDEKVGKFYSPIIENLGDEGEEIVADMINRRKLDKEIPFNMKGITIKNSFILVDEAEDLDLKTLKLVGTRLGKESVMVFAGDYAQAEGKFINNNGLVKLIEEAKGNSLVGIVILPEDIRSAASKIFARLR